MDVEYIKDLRHNYMVILGESNRTDESYCIKMLKAGGLVGVLNLEQRSINNQIHYYYDITSKQALNNLFEKSTMSYSRIKKLFLTITETIEKAYEYLLNENSFLLSPEMIYMDLTTDQVYLCYLPEFQKDIKEQMCSLIEYFMNKVDYTDKEAVLLIYNLYATGKEEGFTFDHLVKAIRISSHCSTFESEGKINHSTEVNTKETKSAIFGGCMESISSGYKVQKTKEKNNIEKNNAEKNNVDKSNAEKNKAEKNNAVKNIIEQKMIDPIPMKDFTISPIDVPFMMEKIYSEQEILCYPWITYLYTGISAIVVLIILWFMTKTKLIYNSLGTRIDVSKLAASLLILTCIVGYLMTKVWDKKKRIAKVISKQEYIDPRIEMKVDQVLPLQEGPAYQQSNMESEEEIYNPTCLISSVDTISCCYLKPVDEEIYEAIAMDSFPFFIGKLKKHVDYCLEKDVVSRYHAKITKEQEQYYITDLNSTNGTFLNKETLQTYQPRELKNGDEISFANISYRFLIPTYNN